MNLNGTLTRGMSARNKRRLGRKGLIKGDNHTGANMDSGAGGDNQTGNDSESGATGATGADNAGQTDALAGFWGESDADGTPSGDSTLTPEQQATADTEFGQSLGTAISAIKFDPVFTPEIAAQINAGDLDGANAVIAAQHQAAIRQSLMLNAKVMQRYGQSLMAQLESKINAKFGNRDSNDTLLASFPSAADPAVRPVIQSVFDRAMQQTKGDRAKAVTLAKDMLKLIGGKAAGDMGITPQRADDDFMSGGPDALVKSLLGRD